MPRLRVQARDLQPGDVCVPTGNVVQRRPEAGVRTPRGKVEVFLANRDGKRLPLRMWGRYTEITVARPERPTIQEPSA